jgi:hypothetical protein
VLKKAGIVVSGIVLGLFAVSPLAFAAGSPTRSTEQVIGDDAPVGPQTGLVNLGDVNALNGLNVCPDVTALLGLGNVLGILGSGPVAQTAADAPITCNTLTGSNGG